MDRYSATITPGQYLYLSDHQTMTDDETIREVNLGESSYGADHWLHTWGYERCGAWGELPNWPAHQRAPVRKREPRRPR